MEIISWGMRHSRTCIVTFFMFILAGVISYIQVPKEFAPDISVPIVYVSLHLDGISPEDSERLLVRPMETNLRNVDGFDEMTSQAYRGGGYVLLEFPAGSDIDKALEDVRNEVETAKADLPDDADDPTVNEVNFSQFPVLVVHVAGDVSERHLLRRTKEIQSAIEGIPTVLDVEIVGERNEVVELVLDRAKVESYGLSLNQVLNLVRRSNLLVAAGRIEQAQGSFDVKVPGLIENLEDLYNLPIKAQGDAVVLVSDIAEIRRTFEDPSSIARLNGRNALAIEVTKKTGENIIDTVEAARAVTDAIQENYQDGVTVAYTQDQSSVIRDRVNDLQNNIATSVVLVLIVILGALGVRAGLLVGLSIPGSFFTALMILYTGGISLNIVVLFGLIMSVGLLVDGTIVVIEYAEREMSAGRPRIQAFANAARRMAWPIIASTATTLVAFAPLLFWPGLVGEFMSYLPITLIIVLGCSLAMALFFVPIIGAYPFVLSFLVSCILAGFVNFFALSNPLLWGVATFLTGIFFFILAQKYVIPFFSSPVTNPPASQENGAPAEPVSEFVMVNYRELSRFYKIYLAMLRFCTRSKLNASGVLVLSVGLLVGVFVLNGKYGRGVEFFPNIEPETAEILVFAQGNYSIYERDNLVKEVETILIEAALETKEISTVYSSTGNTGAQDATEDLIGRILIEFADWKQRPPADRILAKIQEKTRNLPGIVVEVREEEAGPAGGKPVQIELSGTNLDLLIATAGEVRRRLEAFPILTDVEDSRAVPGIEWEITFDRQEALKFDVDLATLGSYVRFVTGGVTLTDYRPDDSDDEIDINLRLPLEERVFETLDEIRVNNGRAEIPVSHFVSRQPVQKIGQIERVDERRIISLKAEVVEGLNEAAVIEEVKQSIQPGDLPPGISLRFRGQDEDRAEAQQFLVQAFAIAIFMMGAILLTQFNSFYQMFLILSAVILSTIGVFLGLMIIDKPFGIVMSGIGVISLAGIVVNNNIVLIDTFNQLSRVLPTAYEAILQTGLQRMRPVLLTTVTTMLGLAALVFEANVNLVDRVVEVGGPSTQWWVHLSSAIFFGLGFATLLTLFVTPAMLALYYVKRGSATGPTAGGQLASDALPQDKQLRGPMGATAAGTALTTGS